MAIIKILSERQKGIGSYINRNTSAGKAISKYTGLVSGQVLDTSGINLSPLNKGWRALLEARKEFSLNKSTNFISVPVKDSSTPLRNGDEDTLLNRARHKEWFYTNGNGERVRSRDQKTNTSISQLPRPARNEITILNYNTSPYTAIVLQNRPDSVDIQTMSNWAIISSIGRNNPFYMFTGAEDTISFEITWYANNPENRRDVIEKCRLLESWSKADGYMAGPPTLKISWGKSGLFDNCEWILRSAPYHLTHFQDRVRTSKDLSSNLDLGLVPNYATQTLTFCKVVDHNLTHEEIQEIPDTELYSSSNLEML